MKKYLLAAWLMAIVATFLSLSSVARSNSRTDTGPEKLPEFRTVSGLDTLRYHDAITTLLLPYIREGIRQAYGKDVMVTPDRVTITRIERTGGSRTYDFLIGLEIKPLRADGGGADRIILKLTHDHSVEVVDYQHLMDD